MAKMTMTCPRCEGRGVIPRYYYNKKGVCFLCWGKKQIQTEVKPGETKEEAYKRVRQREEDHMESQPPKAAIPEKFRNEKFAAAAELDAFNRGQKKAAAEAEAAEAAKPKKTEVPKETKGGSIKALNVLPDYEGGPLAFSQVKYRGKKLYVAPSVKGEAAEIFDSVPLTKTPQLARAGRGTAGKVQYVGLEHATSGEKVLKDQYTMLLSTDYQDSDVRTKVTFNKNGEVSNITHYGTGMHRNREALDRIAYAAVTEKIEGVAERQGLDKPKVKLVGNAFESINAVVLREEAAKQEAERQEAEEKARRIADETVKEEEDRKGLTLLRQAKAELVADMERYGNGVLSMRTTDDFKRLIITKMVSGEPVADVPNPKRVITRNSIDRQVEIETRRVAAYQKAMPQIIAAARAETERMAREKAEYEARREEEWLLDDF